MIASPIFLLPEHLVLQVPQGVGRIAKDAGCSGVQKMASIVWAQEVLCAGHFDVYLGGTFDEVAGEQAKFFIETFEAPVPVVEATEALPLL